MRVLVTGGTGYIGSHTCIDLIKAGHDIVVVDNLCNSSRECLTRVEKLVNKSITFYEADILDFEMMDKIISDEQIEAVIHFAGLKAVGESVGIPLEYYHNNITGTITLCKAMKKNNVKKLIFSSSATVYGEPEQIPITEKCKKGICTNPYGWTKSMIEQILTDLHTSDEEWNIVLLRYFNPIGADKSGLIGEDPKGIPNNLLPYVAQVAVGKLDCISIYGNDYSTKDGTGVRDYIHVSDLAMGHVCAMKKLTEKPDVRIYNLGTGVGYSVLDVIHSYEKACKKELKYRFDKRRAGDIATCYSDASKAKKELLWEAKYDLDTMCEDSYRWQSMNPNGFN